ncbi:pilus assembly protein [Rosenbergiella epipactidis]|uniref:pilus assembly protein n=1 Tax=Rosenbergiella epipactidis TaxID=1544694 RepID=UPI001F4E7F13|nr:pilus assembly protein [Rosenbergiella epipactidis]
MFTRKVTGAIAKLKDPSGGVIISFAILLPLLITLVAFGVNSLKMFIAKAKMSDVASEIGLMVSANSSLSEKEHAPPAALKKMLINYVREFFPESAKPPVLSITYSKVEIDAKDNASYMSYKPNIEVELPFPFYDRILNNGSKTFTVSATPLTVKKKVSRPIDLVFVMDFSGSQAGAGLRLLKETFKDLTDFVLKGNAQSKVAMVPFSSGVAVRYKETNQRGGDKAGCSVLFVPKPEWSINYAFWGDKFVKKNHKTLLDQTYYMDYWRHNFYSSNLERSIPKMPLSVVYRDWCRENSLFGKAFGRVKYSCFDTRVKTVDLDGQVVFKDDIFTKRALQTIKTEYAKAAKIRDAQTSYYTIEHDAAIDYEATLEKMFSDEAVITFPMQWTEKGDTNHRPYERMCHHTGWWAQKGDLVSAKMYSWLIELTNNSKELAEFQTMNVQGYTATVSGLIRSVPVMTKGKNPRKVFVIMADGADTSGPKTVSDRYLRQYKLCDKIKKGILDRPETNAERVDIYYVSTTNDRPRVNDWATYCTGQGNAAIAVNRKAVVDLIKGYLSDEIGSFTN